MWMCTRGSSNVHRASTTKRCPLERQWRQRTRAVGGVTSPTHIRQPPIVRGAILTHEETDYAAPGMLTAVQTEAGRTGADRYRCESTWWTVKLCVGQREEKRAVRVGRVASLYNSLRLTMLNICFVRTI